jgi:hypothetical protein
MKINFLDLDKHLEFAPLTLLKPVATLCMGGFSFEDRWRQFFENLEIGYETESYLSKKYEAHLIPDIRLASNVIATKNLAEFILNMPEGKLIQNRHFIAQKGESVEEIEYKEPLLII